MPDIFDYSLTEGRDVFAWAQQCCAGQSRGIETVLYELHRLGLPVNLDAPTVTGQTWRARLADTRGLAAGSVTDNPIILARPQRDVSGVDVLRGNWFDSAVVKISGLPEAHLDRFDEKIAVAVYFENEADAIARLLDPNFAEALEHRLDLGPALIAGLHAFNGGAPVEHLAYRDMLAAQTLKLAFVISGQGPEAFGMPEMATAMLHIMASRVLKPLVSVISDGRYSGVTYGAAIGHVTPEAARGGGILYLRDGDLLHLRLRRLRLDLLDREAFEREEIQANAPTLYAGKLASERQALGAERLGRIAARRRMIAPTNLLSGCTDASRGVTPLPVAEQAVEPFTQAPIPRRPAVEASIA